MIRDDSAFDSVHDTVDIYRKLLHAMARPGTIGEIGRSAGKLTESLPEHRVALALAVTLLDADVRFAVEMASGKALEAAISLKTYSKPANPPQADYLFADGGLPESAIRSLLPQLAVGTLLQPELAATLIVSVQELSPATPEDATIAISGPGIRDQGFVGIRGLSPVWLSERDRANREYPLGIDLILFDGLGRLCALPRTTEIREEAAVWGM